MSTDSIIKHIESIQSEIPRTENTAYESAYLKLDEVIGKLIIAKRITKLENK